MYARCDAILKTTAIGVRLALVVLKIFLRVGVVSAWHLFNRILSDALVPGTVNTKLSSKRLR